MLRFYLLLWFFWLYKTLRFALLWGGALASLVTLWLYVQEGSPLLDEAIKNALVEIFLFWFLPLFHLAFVFALFLSSKHLFYNCFAEKELRLRVCEGETEEEKIERKNLLRISRKLLFLIIWISAALTLALFSALYLLGVCVAFFSCFSIVWVDTLVLASGFFAIALLLQRCKYIEIKRC